MSAGDLAVTLAAVLCALGFAALVVVLVRVHDALGALRRDVAELRAETQPLIAELRASAVEAQHTIDAARDDLERFDRVLGSAEAISGAVEGSGRVARTALSAPAIKLAGIATGASRAVRRLREGPSDRQVSLVAVDSRRRVDGRRRA